MDLIVNKAFELIENETGVTEIEILSKNRNSNIVFARVLVAWYLKKFDYSSVKIGEILNKDHSTILYYLENLQQMKLTNYKNIRTIIGNIEENLKKLPPDSLNTTIYNYLTKAFKNFESLSKALGYYPILKPNLTLLKLELEASEPL